MRDRTLWSLLVLVAASGWCQPPTQVPVGVMDLLADGTATIGYQFFGAEPSILGSGWTGYDAVSGVYFSPENGEAGKSQVFMHCPWRAGPGVTFAEYHLRLPQAPRIRLVFDTSLRSSAKGSDGVTYRVKVGENPLFEEHCIWKQFRTAQVDLTQFADSEVALRLEVAPGPDKSTTDDWSLWRNVLVLAGSDEQIAQARQRAAEAAARRRAADLAVGERLGAVSLLPLTSHANDSICPSVLQPTQVRVERRGDEYVLRCAGDEVVEYRLDAAKGLLEGLTVSVDGTVLSPAPFTGGPVVVLDGEQFPLPSRTIKTDLIRAQIQGETLQCEYRYTNPETGSSATMSATLWPEGKSLGLEIQGEPKRFAGFSAQPGRGRPVPTAFSSGAGPVWRDGGVYLAAVADLMRSEASSANRARASYAPLTDGTRNTMHDFFYLTATSRYEEALPNLTHQPSPFLDELAGRVVLDVWGGSFAGDEQWLQDMSLYGLNSFLIIKHVWQRDGYDHTYPDTIPANAAQGGDADLRRLSLAAQKLGHRFNVHENYYDYYPNAESFKEVDRCLSREGKPIRGWDNGTVVAVILKPSKLMDYVREFTPEIKRRYDCDSAYHDIMPTWHVDFDAAVPDAGKIRKTHEYTRELCDYDRSIFGGPVVFEAADWRMAGVYDGGCNHGVDTYKTPVAVAAELLKVHPKMSNHGFGYYERWLPWGYGPGWNSYVMTDRELDKYRCYQIAFGRTGFLGQQIMKHPHGLVREYYLMQAFGRAYTGRLAERIRYQVDGKWVDAGTASRHGALDRVNAEYEGGQQVYVNLAEEPMTVAGRTLPQFGTLTTGPRGEAWTAVRDGQICDYAEFEDVTYADARSHVWQPPNTVAPITPSVAELKDVGGGEFELTVNWEVGRTLDRDYIAFWHFRDGGRIAFQRDHTPPKPTTAWRVGETVKDGPLRIHVPDDADITGYDIAVGLYDKQGRSILTRNQDAMKIGRIVVEREGATATKVQLDPVPAQEMPGADPQAYLEGANTDARMIDFGVVATNGAVVVRKTDAGTEIIPVPLGERMTVGIAEARSIAAFDRDGNALEAPACSQRDGKTWFETVPEAAKYTAASEQ